MTLSSFQNAEARTDDQRRALLASIAQSGSAGKQEFDQAQAKLASGRAAAVNEAATRAGAINAPIGAIAEARTTAATPYDQRSADVAQNQAAFGADMQRQSASASDHFSRLGAAIPITESRTRAAVEQIIREQQEAGLERQQDRQMKAMEIADRGEERTFQREMRKSALAKAASGGDLSVSDQIKLADREKDEMMNQSRRFVLSKLRQGASKATQNKFLALTGSAKTMNEALGAVAAGEEAAAAAQAKLDAGAEDPDGTLAEQASVFRGVSPAALQDWIRRYYEPSEREIGQAFGAPSGRRTAPARSKWSGPRALDRRK